MALRRLSYTVRPSSTAAATEAKLSSASTISAASLAASVPLWPIATPTFARLSAGASLTPSPVIATTSPLACSACTRRSLCSGLALAKISTSVTTSVRRASSRCSISAPVSTRTSAARPSCWPIARAVAAWSPVIIFTRMPAARQLATACTASGRGGSVMPSTASRVKPPASTSAKVSVRSPPVALRSATASRRMPAPAASSIACCQASTSSGDGSPSSWRLTEHNANTRSGAPLSITRALPW